MVKMDMSDLTAELTEGEISELEAASEKTLEFDEDSPEMTSEMLAQFKHMNKEEHLVDAMETVGNFQIH